jgi:hypothetical protein
MPGRRRSENSTHALERLIAQLETDTSLYDSNRLRDRLDALDRLDSLDRPDDYVPWEAGSARSGHELPRRVQAIRDRLEAVNNDLYAAIRRQIQRGVAPNALLRCMRPSPAIEDLDPPAKGLGYDYADELIGGVFQFEQPEDRHVTRDSEKLSYQPTPARHIFSLIGLAAITDADVFVDLGSGLGQVPMLVSICTGSRSFGIELEAAYAERARQSAQRLNLNRVTFIRQDAQEADLSTGTIFYLYTSFMGSILSAVLNRLRQEAATRQIRICSYGPCTPVIAQEPWLRASTPPDANSITAFDSAKTSNEAG